MYTLNDNLKYKIHWGDFERRSNIFSKRQYSLQEWSSVHLMRDEESALLGNAVATGYSCYYCSLQVKISATEPENQVKTSFYLQKKSFVKIASRQRDAALFKMVKGILSHSSMGILESRYSDRWILFWSMHLFWSVNYYEYQLFWSMQYSLFATFPDILRSEKNGLTISPIYTIYNSSLYTMNT